MAILGRLNPNWRGGMQASCCVCGAGVWVKPSQASRTRHHCSKACANATLSSIKGPASTRWAGGSETRACATCKGAFIAARRDISRGRARYCSIRCSANARLIPLNDERKAIKRVNNSMTVLMHRQLKGEKRGRRWRDLVGYTAADLVAHLEKQFVPGMSWQNAGAWHVDHIKPKAAFVFTSTEDQAFRDCWSLSNLRPLWAEDNLKKGARLVAAA